MNIIGTLKSAKQLLIDKGWTQGTAARNAGGEEAIYSSPSAACFCTLGAIWRIAGLCSPVACEAERAFKRAASSEELPNGWTIGTWNDAPGRTVEEVLAVFDKAIAAEEASHAPQQ